jgi:hypothetical protein
LATNECFIWILIYSYSFLTYTQNVPKKCYLSLFRKVSLLVAFLLNYCVNFYIIFFFLPIIYYLCSSVGSLALILMPEIIIDIAYSLFVWNSLSQGMLRLTDYIVPLMSIKGTLINWASSFRRLGFIFNLFIVNP